MFLRCSWLLQIPEKNQLKGRNELFWLIISEIPGLGSGLCGKHLHLRGALSLAAPMVLTIPTLPKSSSSKSLLKLKSNLDHELQ